MNIAKATLKANGARTKVVLGDGAAAFDFPRELQARIAAAGAPAAS